MVQQTNRAFELAEAAPDLQNASRVRVQSNLAKTNCVGISPHCSRCNQILCAAWSPSRCHFVFLAVACCRGGDLFLEIGTDALAPDGCAIILLSAPLAEHA